MGQLIHDDERGSVSELAFQRYAVITPHSNPNVTLFIVISGAGYVQVGEERARVNHGEAVVWPAGVPHGAYTDGTEMRAIVIELPDRDAAPLVLEGSAAPAIGDGSVPRADGRLADRQRPRHEHDESEGEPW